MTRPHPPREEAAVGGRPGPTAQTWHSLDALRGLAAVAVLVFHLDPLMENNGESIPGAALGQVGVNVFFVLSGFLIGTSVLSPPRFDRRDYMVRRAARILPLYYASLVVSVLFVDAGPLVGVEGWADLASHLVLVHGLVPDFSTSINGVLWSLSAEWLFYLFMAIVGPAFRTPRRPWLLVGTMAVAGIGWRLVSVANAGFGMVPFWTKTFPAWLDVFAAGLALALLVRTGSWARLRESGLAGAVVGGCGAALTAATLLVYWERLPGPPEYRYWFSDTMVVLWPSAFALATTAVMAALLLCDDALGPFVRRVGLAWLGLVSYSLYVLHPLIIGSLGRAWRVTQRTSMTWGLAAAVVAASLAVSALSYATVEVPGQRWVRARLARDPRPADEATSWPGPRRADQSRRRSASGERSAIDG